MVKLLVLIFYLGMAGAVAWRPGLCLVVILGASAIEQLAQANDPFFISNMALLNYVTGLVVLIGVASSFVKGNRPLSSAPLVTWLVVAFYLFGITSWLWSISQEWSNAVVYFSAPYVITYVMLLPLVFNTREDFRAGLVGTAIVGSALLLMMLFGAELDARGRSFAFSEKLYDRYGVERGSNPLAVASIAGQVILCVAMIRLGGVGRLVTYLRWGIIALGLATIFRSDTRGQLIAVLLTLVVFLPLRSKKLDLRASMAVVASIVLLVPIVIWAFSFSFHGIDRWTGFEGEYMSTRGEMVSMTMAEWIDGSVGQWIFGFGLGSTWHMIGGYPHVILVQALVELGLVGLGILLAILFHTAYLWVRAYFWTKGSEEDRGILAAYGSILFFLFVLSFKQGGLSGSYMLFAFPVLIARLAHVYARERRMKRQRGWKVAPAPAWGTATSASLSSVGGVN